MEPTHSSRRAKVRPLERCWSGHAFFRSGLEAIHEPVDGTVWRDHFVAVGEISP